MMLASSALPSRRLLLLFFVAEDTAVAFVSFTNVDACVAFTERQANPTIIVLDYGCLVSCSYNNIAVSDMTRD